MSSAAMSLEDPLILTPEDSSTSPPNVSEAFWDSAGEQQRYNIWLPGFGIAAVYGLIVIVGLVGNVTLMKTCLQVKSMRTVPNLFLSSLALGDLLLLVTCAPVDASKYLVDQWLFGRVGCKLIAFIQLTSVGVSVFTLTALSPDRTAASQDPLHRLLPHLLHRPALHHIRLLLLHRSQSGQQLSGHPC